MNIKDEKGNTGIDNTGENNSGNWNSGNWNSGNWNSGNRNSGDWNSGNRNSGNGNSGYGNSGNRNSGDGNSGYGNSSDWNSGNRNSGNGNSGYGNSGYGNSGDGNSGDGNSGYGNSTNKETGIFNSIQGKLRIFNKQTDLGWDEIDHPHFNEFFLNEWINEDEMTDKENVEHLEHKTTGGYLKVYSWKEAWANFWKKTDEENRQKFLNLPNFDWKIFTEITGITPDAVRGGDEIMIDGVKYRKVE